MATLSKNILPIPESVVVGSGSYTVPANKYGYFSGSARLAMGMVSSYTNTPITSDSAAVACEQWLCPGTSITVSVSAPSGTLGTSGTSGISTVGASASISINSVAVLGVVTRFYTWWNNNQNYYQTDGGAAWCVTLFPIPIDNLPASLTT